MVVIKAGSKSVNYDLKVASLFIGFLYYSILHFSGKLGF